MKFFLVSALSVSSMLVAASAKPSNLFHGLLHSRQAGFPEECTALCAQFVDGTCSDATCQCAAITDLTACLQCGVDAGELTPEQMAALLANCDTATGTDTATDTLTGTDTSLTTDPTDTLTDSLTDTLSLTDTDTTLPLPTTTTTPPATLPTTTTTRPPTTSTTPRTSTTSTGTATTTGTTGGAGSENGAMPTGVVAGFVKAGVVGAVAALVVL